jgi:bacterioferritin-associated ferredoxin
MPVDRCVCFDITFRELLTYAREHHADFPQISASFGCGKGCALCVPYIRAALATGQTEFPANIPPPASPPHDRPRSSDL